MRCSDQSLILLVADKLLLVQILPSITHFILNIGIYRIAIALFSVRLGVNEDLVIDNAVVFNETSRVNMLDIISSVATHHRAYIHASSRVQTLTKLQKIKEKLIALKLIMGRISQILKLFAQHTDFVISYVFIKLLYLLKARRAPPSLQILGCPSRHFDKDPLGSTALNLNNVLQNIQGADNGTLYRI